MRTTTDAPTPAPTATPVLPEAAAPPRRWVSWLLRLIVAATITGVLYVQEIGAVGGIIALFVLVVPFEKMFPRHDQKIRRPGLGIDLTYAVTQPVLAVAGVITGAIIGILSFAWLPGLAIRPLVAMIPGVWQLIVGFLLFDLAIYWVHRWSHEVPFFWRFHSVHHSSQRMDWISGIRNHPLDGAILAPPFAFLIGAGFSLEFTGALTIIQIITGLFLHANVRWRLRPFHRLVITPEFHHWHHANEADAINHNYSVFLPAWDMAFGTYFMPKERRPQVYGVSEDMPVEFVGQLRYPFRGFRNPLWVLRHPIKGVKHYAGQVRNGVRQLKRSTFRPTRTPDVVRF